MINRYYTDKSLKTLTSKTETYIIKVNGITIDEDYFTICPQDIIKFNDLYEGTTEIFIDVPSEMISILHHHLALTKHMNINFLKVKLQML